MMGKSNRNFFVLAAVFIICIFSPGFALPDNAPGRRPPPLNKNSTLADFITFGAVNNPGLESAYYSWQSALAEVAQAGALPDPVLSYSHYIKEVETKTGPQKNRFGFAQTLPWYGKRGLKKDIALQNALVMEKKFEGKKQNLFYKIKKVWFELYYLGQGLNSIYESLKILEDLEKIARYRFKTGHLSHASLIRLHIEEDQLKNRALSLKEQKKSLMIKLNSLLNRDIYEDIPLPAKVPIPELPYSFEELTHLMKKNSPLFRTAAVEEKKAGLSVKLARKAYYPDIKLGLDYIQTDNADGNISESGKDPLIGTVTLNLPIWFNKYEASVNGAKQRHIAVRKKQNYIKNNLTDDLQMAYFNFTDSLRKIDLYEKSILPNAKEMLSVLQATFISGSADFKQLLDARQLCLKLSLEYERAYTDCRLYLAELSRLTGIDLTRP